MRRWSEKASEKITAEPRSETRSPSLRRPRQGLVGHGSQDRGSFGGGMSLECLRNSRRGAVAGMQPAMGDTGEEFGQVGQKDAAARTLAEALGDDILLWALPLI